MPFVGDDGQAVSYEAMRANLEQAKLPLEEDIDAAPGAGEILGAAFRVESPVGSILSSEAFGVDTRTVEPDLNPWEEIKDDPTYREHFDRFADVRNRAHLDAVKTDIDRETKDRETLSRSPWFGTAAEMGASIVDPTILLPGGAFVRAGKLGYSAARSAAAVGAASVAGAAVSEAALQASQQTRTATQTLATLGAAAALGGLIGAGGAKLLSRGEYNRLAQKLAAETATPADDSTDAILESFARDAQAAGAQAVDPPKLEDYTIDVKAAEKIAQATAINPLLRTQALSASPMVRRVSSMLMENPLYQRMVGSRQVETGNPDQPFVTVPGKAQEQAAETLMKRWRGALTNATREHAKFYSEAVKAGFTGTRSDFNAAVGRVMRRGDSLFDENGNLIDVGVPVAPSAASLIDQAAAAWRKQVFDPLKVEAIDVGIFKPDVKVTTAASYLSRVYLKRKLEAREPEFKKIVRDWAQGNAKTEYEARKATLERRTGRIDQELADLDLTGEAREQVLTQLRDQIQTMQKGGGGQLKPSLDRLAKIADEQRKATDEATKAALKAEAEQIREAGGEELKKFQGTLRGLQARRARVRSNREGLELQSLKVRDTLADIEEENLDRLNRLIRTVERLNDLIKKEGPENIGAKLKEANDAFQEILERSDAAYERLAEARTRDEERITKLRERLETDRARLAEMEEAQAAADEAAPATARTFESVRLEPSDGATWDAATAALQRAGLESEEAELALRTIADERIAEIDTINRAIQKAQADAAAAPPKPKKGKAAAKPAGPPTDEEFADEALRAAFAVGPEGRIGQHERSDLIWISHAYRKLNEMHPEWGMTLDDFKRGLLKARRAQRIRLTLSNVLENDLIETMLESRVIDNDNYELIDIRGATPPAPRAASAASAPAKPRKANTKKLEAERAKAVAALQTDLQKAVDDMAASAAAGDEGEPVATVARPDAAKMEKLVERIAKTEARLESEPALLAKAEDERLTNLDKADRARNAEMTRLSERIDTLSRKDPEKAVTEFKALIEERKRRTLQLIGNADREGVRLSQRLDVLDPARVDARVKEITERRAALERRFADVFEIQRDADDDFVEYASEIADSIFNQLTGRQAMSSPNLPVPAVRGPLKERTFGIKDELIEDFLESDVEEVGARYIRTMGADVELTRKFGSADLKDTIAEVRADYVRLREQISADKSLTPQQRERELSLLSNGEKRDVADLEGVRDILRGSYLADRNGSTWSRILRASNSFNYIRLLGGVTLSSLTDAARPIMVHGLGRFMKGVGQFATNPAFRNLSAETGRRAGVVGEIALNSRLATVADMTDPYVERNALESFIDNSARVFSKLNGLVYFTDFMKTFGTGMSQDRLIRNVMADWSALPEVERRYMLYLGIDDVMADRMRAEVGQAAKAVPTEAGDVNGVWYAGEQHWQDDVVARTFQAALAKDVDSVIITKGVGDVPLFANTPEGRAILQFKTFALSSHQRAFLRAVQEGARGNHWAVVNGMLAMHLTGMFIYMMKAAEQNRIKDLSDNPGRWISEGLDRSGMFALMFEASNTSEKFGGPGIYGGLQALFPGDKEGRSSRYATRGVLGAIAGPNAGVLDDLGRLYGFSFAGKQPVRGDMNAAIRLLPGYSLPVVRSALEWGVKPYVYEAIGD